MTTTHSRSGTILIIVAGLSGLLASIALALLARIQTNNAGDQEILQEAQARLMLVAACNYIQEASRIGWEHPDYRGRYHIETYGWIDVRDGALGPKYMSSSSTLQDAQTLSNRLIIPETPYKTVHTTVSVKMFPIGEPRRFPMYLMQRPPFAIQNRACFNPVGPNTVNADLKAHKRFPDPQPAIDNGWEKWNKGNPGNMDISIANKNYALWAQGDTTPRSDSYAVAWFRLMREPSGSVFLVTVGAGGTLGWRNWKELTSQDPLTASTYFGDEANFNAIQQSELRHWYRVEWSPSVCPMDNHLIYHHEPNQDNFRIFTPNGARSQGQFFMHNMGGTIQWIQRLREEPANW